MGSGCVLYILQMGDMLEGGSGECEGFWKRPKCNNHVLNYDGMWLRVGVWLR